MHDPRVVEAAGHARAEAVTIGEHGLVIAHPRGRGLLLPHVATENRWDARQFLDQLCAKASLPSHTWHSDPQAQLMTFRARLLSDAADGDTELDAGALTADEWEALIESVNTALASASDAEPQSEHTVLARKFPGELGMTLATTSGLSGFAAGAGNSLLDLARLAAQSLRNLCNQKRGGKTEPVVAVSLLCQPIVLKPFDYPRRHRLMARQAVIARGNGSWSVATPNPQQPDDTVGRALHSLNMTPQQWSATPPPDQRPARITAFSVLTYRSTNPNVSKPRASRPWDRPLTDARTATQVPGPGGPGLGNLDTQVGTVPDRPAARAGQFYPADPAAMRKTIDKHLSTATATDAASEQHQYRALMLPHAGWAYCGDTIGRTLARARVPSRAIILGPKHTPFGPPMSVPPHRHWLIPGAAVPIDTTIVARLLSLVPGLACEPEAHRMEHGSEVLIPFLHRLNPDIRITPMTLGQMGYDHTAAVADALATILDETPADEGPILLVISSDMNHFAPEDENRRRDALALNAMRSGDPRRLYDTCRENQISMCGVLPAVTVMQALLKSSSELAMELVDYTTSAAVSGDTSRVVGYAGMVIE
jgi:hypothetical protein